MFRPAEIGQFIGQNIVMEESQRAFPVQQGHNGNSKVWDERQWKDIKKQKQKFEKEKKKKLKELEKERVRSSTRVQPAYYGSHFAGTPTDLVVPRVVDDQPQFPSPVSYSHNAVLHSNAHAAASSSHSFATNYTMPPPHHENPWEHSGNTEILTAPPHPGRRAPPPPPKPHFVQGSQTSYPNPFGGG
jgi:hypothetical protein